MFSDYQVVRHVTCVPSNLTRKFPSSSVEWGKHDSSLTDFLRQRQQIRKFTKYSNHLRLLCPFVVGISYLNNFLCINWFRVFYLSPSSLQLLSCISSKRVLLTHVSPFCNDNNSVVHFLSRISAHRIVNVYFLIQIYKWYILVNHSQ